MRFVGVLCVLLSLFVATQGIYIIDNFVASLTNRALRCPLPADPNQSGHWLAVNCTATFAPLAGTNGSVIIGNSDRDFFIQGQDATIALQPTIVASTAPLRTGWGLNWSVPANARATFQLKWDGSTSTDPINVNYNGYDVDITEGGNNQGVIFRTLTSDLSAPLLWRIYSGSQTISSEFRIDSTVNAGANTTTYVIPFSSFSKPVFASAAADFSHVTAVVLYIDIPLSSTAKSVDLSITELRTAPLFTVTKVDAVMDGAEMVANPGEIIQYTVRVSNDADLLGINFTGVYFYDDPSAISPYLTLIGGSVKVATVPLLPNLTPPPSQVVVESGNQASDRVVSVFYGTLPDGFALEVSFNVSVGNLPCAMLACDYPDPVDGIPAGCQIANQTLLDSKCFCSRNQGRMCTNVADAATGRRLVTSTNNTSFLLSNCRLTDDPATFIASNSQSDSTATPVYAGPDPAITKTLANPAQASGVGPGATVVFDILVTNTMRRTSDNVTLCETIPTGASFNAAGSDGAWVDATNAACSATSTACCTQLGALAASSTRTVKFSVSIINNLPCDVSSINPFATISSAANTPCADINLNNNQANCTVPIIGGSDVYIRKTANKASIAIGTDRTVVYTLSYGNSGARDASGVTIFETVPFKGTFNAAQSAAGWTAVNATTYSMTIGTLAAGAGPLSTTFAVDFPATVDCPDNSTTNNVAITNTCGDTNMANNVASLTIPFTAVPDLQLTMTRTSAMSAGSSVCYTLSYINVGPRTSTTTMLYETVPRFTTFTSTGSSAFTCASSGVAGSSCSLSLGSVTTGQSGNATFCVTVDPSVSCGASTTNNANINGTCNEVDLTRNSATDTAPISSTVTLSLVKSTNVTSVTNGGLIVYTLAYSNTGNGEATGVVLTETVPLSTMFSFEASSSSNGWTGTGNTYTMTIGALPARGTGSATFAIRMSTAGLPGCAPGPVVNTATISQTCGGTTTPTSSNNVTTPIVGNPELSVTAPQPTTVQLASSTDAVVSFTIRNAGNMNAVNSIITVSIPQYATPQADPNFRVVNNQLVYNIGTINAGATLPALSVRYTITRPLPCGVDGLPVTIMVSNNCTEVDMTNNSVNVTIPIVVLPDLKITKTDNLNGATVRVGGTITYTIKYSNAGYRIATDVALREEVGQYGVVVAASNPAWSCSGSVCTYAHPGGTLSINDGEKSLNFTIRVADNVPSRANILNTVRINNTCGEANAVDNVFNTTTPVVGNPDLVITKTDGGISVRPSDVIVYTIGYGNIGDSDAPDVVITETVPAWSTFSAEYSSAGWSCPDGAGAGAVCKYNAGTVARGTAGSSIHFAVKTADWIRCPIDHTNNFVSIAAPSNVVELNYANNNASDDTPIIASPNLQVTVTDNLNDKSRAHRILPGGLIIYQIDYNNCGNRDSVNTMLYDMVPAFTTFNSANSTPGWNCTQGAPAGTLCAMSLPNLMPHDKGTVFFAVNVISKFPAEAKVTTNEVMITNNCGECCPIDNVDKDITYFFGVPDLAIQNKGRCKQVYWYVEYQNVGDQSATNVVITETLPANTTFNANMSTSGWTMSQTSGAFQFALNGPLAPGMGGSLVFVTDTFADSMSGHYETMVTIGGSGRAGVDDPTPENNVDHSHVGFDGCPISCDSCCPEEEECCPDKTEVVFNFGGILDGVSQCQ